MRFPRSSILRSLLICIVSVSAYAQQPAAATLRGSVTDPNGAVVAGATVRATQTATGAVRETQTNDEGVYVLLRASAK